MIKHIFPLFDNEKKTKNKDMTSKRNGGRQLGGGGHLGTKKKSPFKGDLEGLLSFATSSLQVRCKSVPYNRRECLLTFAYDLQFHEFNLGSCATENLELKLIIHGNDLVKLREALITVKDKSANRLVVIRLWQ